MTIPIMTMTIIMTMIMLVIITVMMILNSMPGNRTILQVLSYFLWRFAISQTILRLYIFINKPRGSLVHQTFYIHNNSEGNCGWVVVGHNLRRYTIVPSYIHHMVRKGCDIQLCGIVDMTFILTQVFTTRFELLLSSNLTAECIVTIYLAAPSYMYTPQNRT